MNLSPDDATTTAAASLTSPLTPRSHNSEGFCDLVENGQSLLCVHDLEGRLLSVNSAAARLLGYSEVELLSKPMRDFLEKEDVLRFDVYLEEIKRKGEAHGLLRILTRSGKHLVWEYHNTLHHQEGSGPIVNGIALDVTARVLTEQTLLATNNKLVQIAAEQETALQKLSLSRALLDQANDAVMVLDSETHRFLDVNEKAWSVLGYSRDELLSMTVFDIDPDSTEAERVRVMRSLKESGPSLLERRHRRKDGSTFPVEVNLSRVSLDREYTIAVARDITVRKMAEERLREFGRVVENLEEMIVVVDRDYRFVIANPAYLTYRQLRAEEVLGHRIVEVAGEDLFNSAIKPHLDRCLTGDVVTYELRQNYPELGERDLLIKLLPVEAPAGIERVACVMRDITEQKRAEQLLRASETRARARADELATVFDAMPIPVYISHDASCQKITGNRAAYDELRMTPGSNFSKSAPGDALSPFRLFQNGVEVDADQLPMQQAALTGKSIHECEQTMLFSDGTVRQKLAYAVPLFDDFGQSRGAVGASVDLTDLKDAERALRESEHRFRAVYEKAPIGIALVDSKERKFVQANAKFCEISGRSEEELRHLDVNAVNHPDDERYGEHLFNDLALGKTANGEMDRRYLRPDGSIRWGRVSVVPLWGEEDSRRWHLSLVQDISDRKVAEEGLRKSEERFRVALKNSPIAVFHQDLDLRYTWTYNPQIGTQPDDKLGKRLDEIFLPEEAAIIAEVRQRVLQTGVGERAEVQATVNGKKRYFDTTIEPLVNSAGAVIGLTGASMEITEVREMTDALCEAKRKLTEEKLYLQKEIDTELGFGEIIGKSAALRDVMQQVARVASSNATVLLMGETGTGKELVARAIHRLSLRKGNSFIKMNCAAIPSGLLESELFGHEKGSFTGAISKKIGRLELADRGTLFLDEIGEIALALQPKLLRVLQDQEFERLGSNHTLKVNFRLVAATNSNLADRVLANEFRSDLFYRLNVFPIFVPPLRERREDIPLLIEHFVEKCARRMNKTITSIPKTTMDYLVAWNWPGNVRELENFIERSVILTEGSVLEAPLTALKPGAKENHDQTLESAERDFILRALHESQGKVGGPRGAAMRLGLKRTTLQSKMKLLGINSPSRSHVQ